MTLTLRKLCVALSLGYVATAAQADDLKQIYEQALTTDPVILQAMANRDAAYERIGESRATLLPQVNASLGYDNTFVNDIGAEDGGFNAGVTLSQSIWEPANYVNLDITKQAASQAELAFDLQKQALILRVSQAYFDVLSAQDNLTFVRANKRAIARQLEQTKQRFAVGLTAITDVHEAQAEFDLSVAQEISAENRLDNSYEALREITGIGHSDLKILDTDRFSPSAPTPARNDQWLALAEESSLPLLIDRLGVEISRQQIDLAKTGHQPNFSLNAGYNELFGFDEDDSGFDDASQASIGVRGSINLFSGFAVTSQIEQAKANFVNSQQSLEETHRSIVRTLRAGLNDVNSSISSIRAFEQSVVSAESALQATEAGFEVGTRTIVDVLNSTQQLYSAKQLLADARYTYILAVLNLKLGAGTLSAEDIDLINKGLRDATAADTDGDKHS